MFEGKEGPRIFKQKEHARFAAEKNSQSKEEKLEIQKVRISDQESAEEMEVSVHPDLSITAQKPEEGVVGWIVVPKEGKNISEKYEEALEFLE